MQSVRVTLFLAAAKLEEMAADMRRGFYSRHWLDEVRDMLEAGNVPHTLANFLPSVETQEADNAAPAPAGYPMPDQMRTALADIVALRSIVGGLQADMKAMARDVGSVAFDLTTLRGEVAKLASRAAGGPDAVPEFIAPHDPDAA